METSLPGRKTIQAAETALLGESQPGNFITPTSCDNRIHHPTGPTPACELAPALFIGFHSLPYSPAWPHFVSRTSPSRTQWSFFFPLPFLTKPFILVAVQVNLRALRLTVIISAIGLPNSADGLNLGAHWPNPNPRDPELGGLNAHQEYF